MLKIFFVAFLQKQGIMSYKNKERGRQFLLLIKEAALKNNNKNKNLEGLLAPFFCLYEKYLRCLCET